MIKCSLCNFEIEDNDPDMEIRKQRHEIGRHKKHNVTSQRPYGGKSNPMGNFIYGVVRWVKEE